MAELTRIFQTREYAFDIYRSQLSRQELFVEVFEAMQAGTAVNLTLSIRETSQTITLPAVVKCMLRRKEAVEAGYGQRAGVILNVPFTPDVIEPLRNFFLAQKTDAPKDDPNAQSASHFTRPTASNLGVQRRISSTSNRVVATPQTNASLRNSYAECSSFGVETFNTSQFGERRSASSGMSRGPGMRLSGEYSRVSGEHARVSGEHRRISGEYSYVSGEYARTTSQSSLGGDRSRMNSQSGSGEYSRPSPSATTAPKVQPVPVAQTAPLAYGVSTTQPVSQITSEQQQPATNYSNSQFGRRQKFGEVVEANDVVKQTNPASVKTAFTAAQMANAEKFSSNAGNAMFAGNVASTKPIDASQAQTPQRPMPTVSPRLTEYVPNNKPATTASTCIQRVPFQNLDEMTEAETLSELVRTERVVKTGTLFTIFGLNQNVEREEIRSTFNAIVKSLHPDTYTTKFSTDTVERLEMAYQTFNEAYQIIQHPIKREIYMDISRSEGKSFGLSLEQYKNWMANYKQQNANNIQTCANLLEQVHTSLKNGQKDTALQQLNLAKQYDPCSIEARSIVIT